VTQPPRWRRKGNGKPEPLRPPTRSLPLPDLRGLVRARPDGRTGYGRRRAHRHRRGCGPAALLVMVLAAQAVRRVRRAPPDRPGRG